MIKYKLLKTQLTDTVYPQQVESESFTNADMEAALKKRFGSIAPAVLVEIAEIISAKLADGKTVAIDGLGTFSIRLGMKKNNVTEFQNVHTKDIHIAGVRFNACKELRNALDRVNIQIQPGDALKREKTTDDRWVMLYDHMLQNLQRKGYATTNATSYKLLTGCTDYTARKELEQFAADGRLQLLTARRVKIYILDKKLL